MPWQRVVNAKGIISPRSVSIASCTASAVQYCVCVCVGRGLIYLFYLNSPPIFFLSLTSPSLPPYVTAKTAPYYLIYIYYNLFRGPGGGGAAQQAAALRAEGVTVDTGSLGELIIDLGRFGWFPEILPSESEEAG